MDTPKIEIKDNSLFNSLMGFNPGGRRPNANRDGVEGWQKPIEVKNPKIAANINAMFAKWEEWKKSYNDRLNGQDGLKMIQKQPDPGSISSMKRTIRDKKGKPLTRHQIRTMLAGAHAA